uniref:Mos1 transposase HTH domain-containing protein n=1 Tax=Homalodisca liturata TaxID=320908 RepID=A0A1B6I2H1_9HEMI
MDRSIEQRYAIKFCFRLGKTASETFAMITEAYKEHALSRAQVFRWFNEFKNGRKSVEDMERSGRPSTSRVDKTVAKVKELLDSDRRLSLKMIADEVSMNKFTVHQIVTQDLMMRKVCAKLVSQVLPANKSLVTSYLTRIGVEVLPQPPYSLDMSPPDFFLFPKVKRCLKGHRFDDIPNIQRAVTKALTGITPTDYSGTYKAWKTRWQRCVDAQGWYFEEY